MASRQLLPPCRKYGGVRDKHEHSLSQFWVLEGGVQHNEPGNRTIGLYRSHLAIGALEKEGRHFSSARNLRRILIHTMKEAGFSNLPTEWWHFDYGNQNWAYFTEQSSAIFGAVEGQDT